jgi:hypothetical protein
LTIGSSLYGNNIYGNSLNISNNSFFTGSITCNSNILVSGDSSFNGNCSVNSNIFISGSSIVQGNSTLLSNILVSGNSFFKNPVSCSSTLSISGNTTIYGNTSIYGNTTINSSLNILNTCLLSNIPEYTTNANAAAGGVPLWGLYRTGGIIKIRLDDTAPTLTLLQLNGSTNITINQYGSYTEPGATATDNIDSNIIPYITSITSADTGELITTPIALIQTNLPITIDTNFPRVYTITYTAVDTSGNYSLRTRTLTVRELLRTLIYNNTNISQANFGGRNSSYSSNNLINGFRNAWCISSAGLVSLGFNFTGNWKFIMKGRIVTSINKMIEISIDPSFTAWTSSNAIQYSGRYAIEFGGPNAGGDTYGMLRNPDGSTTIFSTNNDLMPCLLAGFYSIIKYFNNYITIEFVDLNGTSIYTWTSPISITYTNNQAPFNIYMDSDTCNFYNGILYDITSGLTSTYSDFNTKFNITP